MTEPEWIAECTFWAVDKDGRGFDVGLQIGRPYQTDSPLGDWACPLAMIGLQGRFPDIGGVDSWQALALAVDLTKKLLKTFVEVDGGKLYYEKDGAEATVDEVLGIPGETVEEEPIIDRTLTPEEEVRVGQLSARELETIDAAILRNCSRRFRKIALVVGLTMVALHDTIPNLPDVFYASRVRHLVAEEKLEAQGAVTAMRFGEVKLSATNTEE